MPDARIHAWWGTRGVGMGPRCDQPSGWVVDCHCWPWIQIHPTDILFGCWEPPAAVFTLFLHCGESGGGRGSSCSAHGQLPWSSHLSVSHTAQVFKEHVTAAALTVGISLLYEPHGLIRVPSALPTKCLEVTGLSTQLERKGVLP